jgi:hypothetical protein
MQVIDLHGCASKGEILTFPHPSRRSAHEKRAELLRLWVAELARIV